MYLIIQFQVIFLLKNLVSRTNASAHDRSADPN